MLLKSLQRLEGLCEQQKQRLTLMRPALASPIDPSSPLLADVSPRPAESHAPAPPKPANLPTSGVPSKRIRNRVRQELTGAAAGPSEYPNHGKVGLPMCVTACICSCTGVAAYPGRGF